MDICSFINSKDIAEYLRSIDYDFTLPEAAFIVYQSEHRTLLEKCEAWLKLIDTMPDCSMEERLNLRAMESFHRFLRDYMELQRKIVDLFYEPTGSVYTYKICETGGKRNPISVTEYDDYEPYWVDAGDYFTNAESAISHFEREKEDYAEDGMLWVRFVRISLLEQADLDKYERVWIEMTPDLEVMDADIESPMLDKEERILLNQFDGMWFAFPTPFKRGEILINRSCCGGSPSGPFVLDGLVSWDADTLIKNGFSKQNPMVKQRNETIDRLAGYGDTSDMDYYAVYLDADDMGFPVICSEVFWTYLNLERYEGPLQGIYRVLKPVSSAMTYDPEYDGPSIEPELFCSAYRLIASEEMCKANRAFLESCYPEKRKELAGLKQ